MAVLKALLLLLLLSAPLTESRDHWLTPASDLTRPRWSMDTPYGGRGHTFDQSPTIFRRHGDLLSPRITRDERVLPWESIDPATRDRIQREASQLFG